MLQNYSYQVDEVEGDFLRLRQGKRRLLTTIKKVLTNWTGIPKDFSPEGLEGFVYLIVNTLTDKKYIGKKFFWSKRRLKVKGKKRRKIRITESDWKYYKSSSLDLKADIEEFKEENFTFTILSLHKTRGATNYTEVKEQFIRDVLYSKINGDYEYYNTNILGRYYRRINENLY